MMTAKEKATELLNNFYPRCTSYSADRKNQKENAKQCALICVDEMIDITPMYIGNLNPRWEYLQEVKIELNK